MIRKFIAVVLGVTLPSIGWAEGVGIKFDQLNVGTKLTTQMRGFSTATYIEEYIGMEDGFHLIQIHKKLDDGSTKKLSVKGYDTQGRQVFSRRQDGKVSTYSPYSCRYALGNCTHIYDYYNPITKKMVVNEGLYFGKLEGNQYILTVFTSDGDSFDVPYELDENNLRLRNIYKNALDQPAGFEFVDVDYAR